MKPLVLQGHAALSDFRVEALKEALTAQDPNTDTASIEANYIYMIEADGPLDSDTLQKTQSLLGAALEFNGSDGFFVTPRFSTISPWSSKATDIFHNCGLSAVRRVERGIHFVLRTSSGQPLALDQAQSLLPVLHDRMTEGVYDDLSEIFAHVRPPPYREIDVLGRGCEALQAANIELGLALSDEEIDYLFRSYTAARRNPTDVELVMFGQVNSEHCRHKIFNADWIVDGETRERSLFDMIRNTHELRPEGTLIAYCDNSGVVEGFEDEWFEVARDDGYRYRYDRGQVDMIMKVETHNHPTAISPYPGAATGSGGEIRDESATGTGGKSKAGLCGFMVSNLRVPDFMMPWEKDYAEFPRRLATPLQIMTEGPLGGARFGNEFGRPQLLGLFRTFETEHNGRYRGYHKPIMIAGGMGNIKRIHVLKKDIPPGAQIVQLGGPAMRIGLGGGAASSMATGTNAEALDFDSVQRDNAEMERRCQELIDACISLKEANPILSIHDIGAGGLSNGCPELVAETGGEFWLRNVPNEDMSMSPMEIWCCEAQERYVLAILPESVDRFMAMAARERCPAHVIGQATGDNHLSLHDKQFDNMPIDIDIGVILGKPPKMLRDVKRLHEQHAPLALDGVTASDALQRVLQLPTVANKTFLITIADRSVTGMVTRDQMVGPYQTPIADMAVTVTSHNSLNGEAMAMGERTPIAVVSGPAAGRMAIGEALTNIAAANVGSIRQVRLSANWMCACGEEGEDARLYDTVHAVGMELCPKLGISIPVGKDSLSMRSVWETSDGTEQKMIAPLSLIVSAFSPVLDVRKTVTPDLKDQDSRLLYIDLGGGRNRLGCSALAQTYNQVGGEYPDVDDPELLVAFFEAVQELLTSGLLLAYHDRSDGGLAATLCEMAFGGRRGLAVDIGELGEDSLAVLLNEELGAVLQVATERLVAARDVLSRHGVLSVTHDLGALATDGNITILCNGETVVREKVVALNRTWSALTYQMQAHRDNPACAEQEYEGLLDENDPGMQVRLTFDPAHVPSVSSTLPRMAILREQGINGQVEMAAAFDRAGFECVDVHMTDLHSGRVRLDDFVGLVACGGFSYGDVLGAGSGWAKSILFNDRLKHAFSRFFSRTETFALGVCNGCQMLAQLRDIIPGAGDWPDFVTNTSEQFEARYVTVEIMDSPSIFFRDMKGSLLGIPVAHGEGRAEFGNADARSALEKSGLISARYVDNYGRPTERYPLNPNGSPGGITGMTTHDGRVTVMMPHPERVFRAVQLSYRPANMFEGEDGPWIRMFRNARMFVG